MTSVLASLIDYDKIVLSDDQQTALDAINGFLLDPDKRVFVLEGHSGCGKSTLVRIFLDRLPGVLKMARMIDPDIPNYDVQLTATTNKAAEQLASLTAQEATTIHSALGLRISTDYSAGKTTLIPKNQEKLYKKFLVVDEAGFADKQLLQFIFSRTEDCKILLLGDPSQLRAVNSANSPAFEAGFECAKLREVMRQPKKGSDEKWVHPITALGAQFRHTVETSEWLNFEPDGQHVIHMDRTEFNEAIKAEFTRPDWKHDDSTVLGWQNKTVIAYNQYIRNLAKGDPHFQVGDYAVCNTFVQGHNKTSLKTDQLVFITDIGPDEEELGVMGKEFTLNGAIRLFMPNSLADKNERLKQAKAAKDFGVVARIEGQWVDLRAAYARTINKAQGSTYSKVFLDLDDIGRCNNGDTIARMLYVGVTRAANQVVMTGDF